MGRPTTFPDSLSANCPKQQILDEMDEAGEGLSGRFQILALFLPQMIFFLIFPVMTRPWSDHSRVQGGSQQAWVQVDHALHHPRLFLVVSNCRSGFWAVWGVWTHPPHCKATTTSDLWLLFGSSACFLRNIFHVSHQINTDVGTSQTGLPARVQLKRKNVFLPCF